MLKSVARNSTGNGPLNEPKRMCKITLHLLAYLKMRPFQLNYLSGHCQHFSPVPVKFRVDSFFREISNVQSIVFNPCKVYRKRSAELMRKSKTSNKPHVEKWAKEYLEGRLSAEYELYQLIKRIFYYKITKLGFEDIQVPSWTICPSSIHSQNKRPSNNTTCFSTLMSLQTYRQT